MTLRELRLQRGISQTCVADVLRVTQQHYSKMELGYERLQQHHRDVLEWRYGWRGITDVTPPPRRRMRNVSHPIPQQGMQAEMIALLALASYKAAGNEIPEGWRDRWRHRGLWAKAVRVYLRRGVAA